VLQFAKTSHGDAVANGRSIMINWAGERMHAYNIIYIIEYIYILFYYIISKKYIYI